MSTIIISSGEVSSGLVANYATPIVVAGGTATNTLISGGSLAVSSGGLTDFTSMTEYGSMTVFVNGRADRTTLGDAESSGSSSYSYNSMTMIVSGIANNTTINSGAKVSMYNGAQMTSTTVNSGGSFCIYGGTANNTFQYEGGHVSNTGGTMNGATLEGWGGVYASGDTAIVNSAVINSGASIYAVGSAKVNNTEINSGGTLYIYGGTASVATVNEGGCLSQGSGVVQGAIVNLGGVFYAGMYWDGNETASALNVMENGGAVNVGTYSSDYNDPDSVKYFPVEFVSNSFSGLVYSKGGSGTVHSGTTATDITATNGGINVYAGGILNGITISDSTFASSNVWTDENGKEQVSVYDVYQTGKISVMSGGTATGIVGSASGDGWDDPFYFEIAPGTVISGTVNGEKFSSYIGVLEKTRTSNVKLAFLSGATVTSLDMYEGGAMAYAGAKVSSINLSGTVLTIASNAVVNGITTTPIPSSYVEEPFWGDDSDAEPVVIETMKGAAVSVYQGATVTDLNMDDQSFLYMTVASNTVIHGTSGGQAIDMENAYFADNELGSTYVYVASTTYEYDSATGSNIEIAGGTAANLIINNGAVVVANYGGKAFNMTENGGALEVDDYDMEGISYSVASNTFSNRNLTGQVTIHKNTVAHDCVMSNGAVTVYSGGIVSNFYFFQKGMGISDANIYSGAIVTNLDMTRFSYPPFHGGHVEIQSGAIIDGLRLQSDDFVYISLSSESVIKNASVDGKPFSFEDNVLSGFRINEGMNSDLNLGEGITAVDIWVTDCPIYTDGGVHGINVTLDRSYTYLNDGDYFENLTVATGTSRGTYERNGSSYVDYDYGSATVNSGAIIDGVTVNNGGTLHVETGGKITGVMRFADAASVVCSSGATIDFDLTEKNALYVARSNDWRFNGRYSSDKQNFTITIDQQQGAGTYVLSNSAYFSDSKDFYVVDGASGHEYGYFSGYFTYEWVSEEETYRYYFVSSYSGETIEGLTLTMDAIQIDRDDGVLDFDLVLKVESAYTAPKWIAAPTVTASNDKFTCDGVILTVTYDDSVVSKEYSNNGGTSWNPFDGTCAFDQNVQLQFRGKDAEGTYTDVATYTVSNIDEVAPTVATSLTVDYDDTAVVLAWTDATDDFSGVCGYLLSCWQDGKDPFSTSLEGTMQMLEGFEEGTWHWGVQTLDYAGNRSDFVSGADFVIGGGTVSTYVAKGDVDGNGVSDVLFQYTGGDYQLGYWMNGTNAWRGQGLSKPAEWEVLGSYDMNRNGNADALLVGNVEVGGVKGAYIGYYLDSVDTDANWQNIGYLNNADDIGWKNKVGNLTGADKANSIVWYAPELYALGVWLDGTDSWVTLSGNFGGDAWTLVGCGDFAGTGRDAVLMTYNNGQLFYSVDITGTPTGLGSANWSGWEVRAIGDFSGDKKDDLVLFHKETGSMVMLADGNADSYTSIGQLDKNDWFVVGAGDYNGDKTDDLLVRQISTGMLGYYTNANIAQWNTLGYGVDMNWTVIA